MSSTVQLTTINESINPVEVSSSSPPIVAKATSNIIPAPPPAVSAPVFKFHGSDAIFSTTRTSDAIFSVVPINADSYGPYGKPNAIVRPVRRNEPSEMILPQAATNEVTAAAAAVAAATAAVAAAAAAANQPATNQSTPKHNVPGINKKPDIDTFTKELENKLRHLQKDKKISTGNVIFFIHTNTLTLTRTQTHSYFTFHIWLNNLLFFIILLSCFRFVGLCSPLYDCACLFMCACETMLCIFKYFIM